MSFRDDWLLPIVGSLRFSDEGLAAFVGGMALLINALNVSHHGTNYCRSPFIINDLVISPAVCRLKIKIEMQRRAAKVGQ